MEDNTNAEEMLSELRSKIKTDQLLSVILFTFFGNLKTYTRNGSGSGMTRHARCSATSGGEPVQHNGDLRMVAFVLLRRIRNQEPPEGDPSTIVATPRTSQRQAPGCLAVPLTKRHLESVGILAVRSYRNVYRTTPRQRTRQAHIDLVQPGPSG